MQIHMFIAHLSLGGAERVCVNLANEFARNGHEVHIVVLNLKDDMNSAFLDSRVKVFPLCVSRLRYAAVPMLRYIRKSRPPFLLVFGNEMAVILNKLKHLHLISTPLIERVLNNVEITLSKDDHISPVVEAYLKKAQIQMRQMNHIVAQCHGMEEMLLRNGLAQKGQITTIYNPVSNQIIEKTDQLRVPLMQRQKQCTKTIVFIGRIDPQKNLKDLIDAFKMLQEKMPDCVLELYGEGSLCDYYKEYVKKQNLTDKIHFNGISHHMEQVYAKADVVALSSDYEGMPNCLIEAIACGIPVVSYDCPLGPAEIIEDGVNGYLVEFHNREKLSESLFDALQNEWNEIRIKQSAQKFQVQKIAKQYMSIFEEIK